MGDEIAQYAQVIEEYARLVGRIQFCCGFGLEDAPMPADEALAQIRLDLAAFERRRNERWGG